MVRFPNGDYLELEMNTLISQVIYGRSWQEVATDPRFRVNIIKYQNWLHCKKFNQNPFCHLVFSRYIVIYIDIDISYFSNGAIAMCQNISRLFAG